MTTVGGEPSVIKLVVHKTAPAGTSAAMPWMGLSYRVACAKMDTGGQSARTRAQYPMVAQTRVVTKPVELKKSA